MSAPLIAGRAPLVQLAGPGTCAWCSCGRSAKQPCCDGSHGDTGFAPLVITLEQPRTVAWCACKHTKRPPFCDGSHAQLP